MSQYQSGRSRQYPPRRRRRVPRWVVVCGVALILGPILFNSVFSISKIEVQGNKRVSAEEVVAASGIKRGDNILSIDIDKVRDSINNNRYLEFVGLWRNFFPSSVILTVTEHAPRAKMAWMGMLVVLGENGVVLEQTAEIDASIHVPEIIGMTATQVRVGLPISYSIPGQGEAVDNVIDALDLQGIGSMIAEINVASPESMFLVTEEGLQVNFGNDEQLPEKFALFREVLPRIQTMGAVAGGLLDISTAKTADYRPPKPAYGTAVPAE